LKISFSNVKSSKTSVLRGESYVISGIATIQGTCTNCVIETGLDYYGIWQGFSTTSKISSTGAKISSTGACGNDKSVGIKIASANDGDVIQFTLTDSPKLEMDGISKV
jgi:hypothetical protein